MKFSRRSCSIREVLQPAQPLHPDRQLRLRDVILGGSGERLLHGRAAHGHERHHRAGDRPRRPGHRVSGRNPDRGAFASGRSRACDKITQVMAFLPSFPLFVPPKLEEVRFQRIQSIVTYSYALLSAHRVCCRRSQLALFPVRRRATALVRVGDTAAVSRSKLDPLAST